MKINAGVVCVTKFCTAQSSKFTGYIDYIDRDSATRKSNVNKFDLFDGYLEYMDNEEKTAIFKKGRESDLFTKFEDKVSKEGKQNLKSKYKLAQKNGSNMWQTVISFDNKYLEKNGIYNKKDNVIDEKKLISISRAGIEKMLANEGLENAIWSASIHYNTDNVHIHVATAETSPQREKCMYFQWKKSKDGKYIKQLNSHTGRYEKVPILDKNGKQAIREEYKGRFKKSSIEALKKSIVSDIEIDKSANIQITNLLRSIVNDKKERLLMQDEEFSESLKKIYIQLKKKSSSQNLYRNNWTYNRNAIADLRSDIDSLSKLYIKKHHKEDFDSLKEKLKIREKLYQESYGGNNNYADNKIKELYERLGNTILRELKDYDRALMRKYIDVKNTDKYFEPGSFEYNPAKGIRILNSMDKEGNTFAMNKLGLIYFSGSAVKKDIKRAKKYFKKSADLGDEFGEKMFTYANEKTCRKFLNMGNYAGIINKDLEAASWHLKQSMREDYNKYMNMAEFEKLQFEIEKRGEEI